MSRTWLAPSTRTRIASDRDRPATGREAAIQATSEAPRRGAVLTGELGRAAHRGDRTGDAEAHARERTAAGEAAGLAVGLGGGAAARARPRRGRRDRRRLGRSGTRLAHLAPEQPGAEEPDEGGHERDRHDHARSAS